MPPPVQKNRESAFTLLEVIGVLAVMATLMAIMLPNVINQLDRAAQEAESQNLRSISQGIEMYVRDQLDIPNSIAQLSPNYVPFTVNQLQSNDRGQPRYLNFHPDLIPFNNGNGVGLTDLERFRYLVITNLSQDANPTISNSSQFTNWWELDETPTPDLVIYRGSLKPQFHLVSLSAVGIGGSYSIDSTQTSSGGSTLTTYGNYHLTGSLVELSEDDNFGGGTGTTISFRLTTDVGFQFDPNCSPGSKWHILGTKC